MADRGSNRTVLITGATRGLGLALAQGLAARGWTLLLTGRAAGRLLAVCSELAEVTAVSCVAGDINVAAHRARLARAARDMGGLDAVINNAGALGPSPLPALLDTRLDALEAVLRTNVVAPLGVLQAVRGELRPGARVINVSSDAAVNAYPGWGAYGTSKAAFEQLSAVLAVENPDLRVYWVDPGDMWTDMHQAAYPGEDVSDRPLPSTRVPAFIALLEETLPSGRHRAEDLLPAPAQQVSA